MQTIRGYILALPRTAGKEETVRVTMVTDDGTEYHVLHKGAGTGLAADINANVEVTGTVISPVDDTEDQADRKALLHVHSYRLTDGLDDPWYDDTVR